VSCWSTGAAVAFGAKPRTANPARSATSRTARSIWTLRGEQSQVHWRTIPQPILLRMDEVISTIRVTFALATLVTCFRGRSA